ncbi:hypothetical protein M758_UG164400 [Ceratodon purpureus]|nr:hypothetical protein M758_UG164400 [Ceratodon purpureus]
MEAWKRWAPCEPSLSKSSRRSLRRRRERVVGVDCASGSTRGGGGLQPSGQSWTPMGPPRSASMVKSVGGVAPKLAARVLARFFLELEEGLVVRTERVGREFWKALMRQTTDFTLAMW